MDCIYKTLYTVRKVNKWNGYTWNSERNFINDHLMEHGRFSVNTECYGFLRFYYYTTKVLILKVNINNH